jgi:hypothetical protein
MAEDRRYLLTDSEAIDNSVSCLGAREGGEEGKGNAGVAPPTVDTAATIAAAETFELAFNLQNER